MSDKSIVIQIQSIGRPFVAESAYSLMSCVAMLVAEDAWHVEADVAEDCCNIHVRVPSPAAKWKRILALLSGDPSSLRILEDRWIVVCEGQRGWDDYKTLAHFMKDAERAKTQSCQGK